MAAPPSVTYVANERVLCFHGPLLYEAKVLKVDTWDEQTTKTGFIGPQYFVHYKGWKASWDEWVPSNRLLKFNDANVAHQKSLQASQPGHGSASAAAGKAHKASAAGASARGVARKDGARGTKRGRDEDDGARRPEMKLAVPEALKQLLVDDWEAVTKNNQLIPLPRDPTVVEVLEEFKTYILEQPPAIPHLRDPQLLLPTVIAGLQVYFDKALGTSLLYRFERNQYAAIRKEYVTGPHLKYGEETDMSGVYGAEHLLRMLVSMPQMVVTSTMDAESTLLVRDYVNELMVYMLKERDRLFVAEYEAASQQYQNVSRT